MLLGYLFQGDLPILSNLIASLISSHEKGPSILSHSIFVNLGKLIPAAELDSFGSVST